MNSKSQSSTLVNLHTHTHTCTMSEVSDWLGNNRLSSMMLINLIPTGTHSLPQDMSLLLQRKLHPRDREKERDTEEERESDDDETELKMKTDTSLIILSTHDQCFQLHSLQSVSRTGHSGITKCKLVL